MIIFGYYGVGKSTLAHNDPEYIDLDSRLFVSDNFWYMTYARVGQGLSEQGGNKVLMMADRKTIKLMNADPGKKYIVAPSLSLKDEWINRLYEKSLETCKYADKSTYLYAKRDFDSDIAWFEKLAADNDKLELIRIESMGYNLRKILQDVM